MSTGSIKSTIRLSLLDRLLDDEPGVPVEARLEESQLLRIMQHAIRRDLQNLLNTRYRIVAWPPELTELDDSLINYGIPDFTAASLNAAEDCDVLVNAIRTAIAFFEPRLSDVQLERVGHDYVDRTFRFRIEAMLLIEEKKHRVQFDSTLESDTGQFSVQ